MKKTAIVLFLFLCCLYEVSSRNDSACAVKIGGNYYINCKHIILFKGQDVLTITNAADKKPKISFDVYSSDGTKKAVVNNGRITEGDKTLYTITNTGTEFTFVEKATGRIICYVKQTFNKKKNICQFEVWCDMYMPGGFYFQATPATTNIPMLNGMTDSTFTNSETAISLN